MKKSKGRSATAITIDETSVEISREEAKESVLKLFEEKGELDYIDIASTLDLDLKLIVEICSELVQEKRIEEIE